MFTTGENMSGRYLLYGEELSSVMAREQITGQQDLLQVEINTLPDISYGSTDTIDR